MEFCKARNGPLLDVGTSLEALQKSPGRAHENDRK